MDKTVSDIVQQNNSSIGSTVSWPQFFDLPCSFPNEGYVARGFHEEGNPFQTTYGIIWFILAMLFVCAAVLMIVIANTFGLIDGCLQKAIEIDRNCYNYYYLPEYVTYAKKAKEENEFLSIDSDKDLGSSSSW